MHRGRETGIKFGWTANWKSTSPMSPVCEQTGPTPFFIWAQRVGRKQPLDVGGLRSRPSNKLTSASPGRERIACKAAPMPRRATTMQTPLPTTAAAFRQAAWKKTPATTTPWHNVRAKHATTRAAQDPGAAVTEPPGDSALSQCTSTTSNAPSAASCGAGTHWDPSHRNVHRGRPGHDGRELHGHEPAGARRGLPSPARPHCQPGQHHSRAADHH